MRPVRLQRLYINTDAIYMYTWWTSGTSAQSQVCSFPSNSMFHVHGSKIHLGWSVALLVPELSSDRCIKSNPSVKAVGGLCSTPHPASICHHISWWFSHKVRKFGHLATEAENKERLPTNSKPWFTANPPFGHFRNQPERPVATKQKLQDKRGLDESVPSQRWRKLLGGFCHNCALCSTKSDVPLFSDLVLTASLEN